MSVKNKTDLKSEINTDIVSNASRSITATKLNTILINIADSMKYNASGQVSSQSSDYILSLSDAGNFLEINSSSNVSITVPNNTDVPFDLNARIDIYQHNTGIITIQGDTGVFIRSFGNKYKTAGLYSVCTLIKKATNEWVLTGDLTI